MMAVAQHTEQESGVAMARRGGLFMRVFALLWAAVGLIGAINLGLGAVAIAIAATGAALVVLHLLDRRASSADVPPGQVAEDHQRRFRQVGIAQGVLIGIVVAGFVVLQLPQFITPGVALVVGAHFWPLARIFGLRDFWIVGWRLVAVAALGAIAGFWSGPLLAQTITGLGAAAVLWAAAASTTRAQK